MESRRLCVVTKVSSGFLVAVAGRRLIFDNDLSDFEVDSELGINSERGNDHEVTLVGPISRLVQLLRGQ